MRTLAISLGGPPLWVPILLAVVAAALAMAVATTIYVGIRGEYLKLPADPGGELDALSRLLGSFARFSVRSRRMIRALSVLLVLDFMLSAAFGYLGYEYVNNRCVPYEQITASNRASRHLWLVFVLGASEKGPTAPSPAEIHAFKVEIARDYPDVSCP